MIVSKITATEYAFKHLFLALWNQTFLISCPYTTITKTNATNVIQYATLIHLWIVLPIVYDLSSDMYTF